MGEDPLCVASMHARTRPALEDPPVEPYLEKVVGADLTIAAPGGVHRLLIQVEIPTDPLVVRANALLPASAHRETRPHGTDVPGGAVDG